MKVDVSLEDAVVRRQATMPYFKVVRIDRLRDVSSESDEQVRQRPPKKSGLAAWAPLVDVLRIVTCSAR